MSAQPVDTGGLGLIQLLQQAGITPTMLHQFLLQRSVPQSTQTAPSGDSGASAPAAPAGAVTGRGNMSGSESLSAALSGLPGGLIGQAIGDMTGANPSMAGLGGKAAITALGFLGGHLSPLGYANTPLGLLYGLARGAQASMGTRGDQTFGEAAKEFADNARALFGFPRALEAPLPNYRGMDPEVIDDPDQSDPTTGPPATNPDYSDAPIGYQGETGLSGTGESGVAGNSSGDGTAGSSATSSGEGDN